VIAAKKPAAPPPRTAMRGWEGMVTRMKQTGDRVSSIEYGTRPVVAWGTAGLVNCCEAGTAVAARGNCWQAGTLRSRGIKQQLFRWRVAGEVGARRRRDRGARADASPTRPYPASQQIPSTHASTRRQVAMAQKSPRGRGLIREGRTAYLPPQQPDEAGFSDEQQPPD